MGELDTGIQTFSKIFKLSFSGKKIVIGILGILCACIAWLVITGLGELILHERLYGLLRVINWIVTVFIMFFTLGAIAKVTIAEISGAEPVGANRAVRSALKYIRPLVIAPLKIVALIIVLMIAYYIAGLIGLIPYFGEIIWPFFTIPLFLLSALIVVAKLILLCGLLLLPTIIMLDKQSPVSELNDFLRENTLRFIGYLIATAVVVWIVLAFLNVVVATNIQLSSSSLGDKYSTIVASMPTKLAELVQRLQTTFTYLFNLLSPGGVTERLWSPAQGAALYEIGWTYTFSGLVWGVFTLILYLAIWSLPLVVWGVAGTLIYLGLKPDAVPLPKQECEGS